MKLVSRHTSRVFGAISPPGSKSHSIRAFFLAMLARGTSVIRNSLDSDDSQHAAEICRHLGAQFDAGDGEWRITGGGLPLLSTSDTLYSGNSGITTRFVLPLLGLRDNCDMPVVLDCGDQMRDRPIRPLLNTLNHLGMRCESIGGNDCLPVRVSGALRGGEARIDGTTSQYLSALLLATPLATHDSRIVVPNLHERPYMEMTLHWLRLQNISYRHDITSDGDIFHIPGKQSYSPFTVHIPADFSSASYGIAAGVLQPGEVVIRGLDMNDPQGDKRLIEILRHMGARIDPVADGLRVIGGEPLQGGVVNANDIPDLLPTLAVIGTCCASPLRVANVKQARIKETDRIHSMTEGLRAMGACVDEHDDGMTIHPGKLTGAVVHGYDDHRTVMALALAGMLAQGATVIDTAESIAKTYPRFVDDMQAIGAAMDMSHD